ncbi:MAG: amidohydrolase family protein, partial [Candidatus Hydrogenedentes bacterium]|nr:amidohydrolase family protein [Candidatus Hydrogenedentota bacterium]
GRSRVMFGTNYPMLTPEVCLGQVPTLGLSDEVLEMFLHANAERVFGI